MSTQNIQFHNKLRKFPKVLDFLSYRKKLIRIQNVFELDMVNEPWMIELLRFGCTFFYCRSAIFCNVLLEINNI